MGILFETKKKSKIHPVIRYTKKRGDDANMLLIPKCHANPIMPQSHVLHKSLIPFPVPNTDP